MFSNMPKKKAGPDGAGAGGLLLPHIGDLPPPPLSAAEAAAAAGLVPMVSTAPAPMETVPMAAAPVGADAMLGGASPEALAMATGAVVTVMGSKCAVADCVAPVGWVSPCFSVFSLLFVFVELLECGWFASCLWENVVPGGVLQAHKTSLTAPRAFTIRVLVVSFQGYGCWVVVWRVLGYCFFLLLPLDAGAM